MLIIYLSKQITYIKPLPLQRYNFFLIYANKNIKKGRKSQINSKKENSTAGKQP